MMNNLSNDEVNLLRQNARSVVRELGLLNDAYFDIGVTLAERHLLIELSTCLYPTVGDIAERLLLDKSTASRLIAKAVKKGYVEYSTDENDKRKRFLQFTQVGRNVLNAFEPIAFNQTKDALLTLTAEEIKTVYKGIELYAKGLKNSRLRNKIVITKVTKQDHAGIAHLLAECFSKVLQHNREAEWTNLFERYRKKESSYFVMKMDSKIIGGAGFSLFPSNEPHVCELERLCIQPEMHDFGFEKMLLDHCLKEAKKVGYDQCYIDTSKETLFPIEFFLKQGFQKLKNNKQKASILWKAC